PARVACSTARPRRVAAHRSPRALSRRPRPPRTRARPRPGTSRRRISDMTTFRGRRMRGTARTPAATDTEAGAAAASSGRSPEQEKQRALQAAFRALGRRALSAAELRAKLAARELPEEAIAAALERVTELGYLAD